MNRKKITRSVTDRVLAGICGGLGQYFDTDPVVFRILFCVFGITGSGIIAYLILIFVIPSEKNVLNSQPTSGISEEKINEVTEEIKTEIIENVKNNAKVIPAIAGIILITIGICFLFPLWPLKYFIPSALIACGIVLLFLQGRKS